MESKSNLHYNYVYFNANCNGFILNPDEYNAICTRDLESLDNVQVVQAPLQMSSCILRFLFNVHNDERISRRVCVPFKKIWYPLYFKDNFTNQKPLCLYLLLQIILLTIFTICEKNIKIVKLLRYIET